MHVLALDVGTSSTRAICFDETGRALSELEARVAYQPRTTTDGGVELDADTLLEALFSVVGTCLARAGRGVEIGAVGLSVFWHGLLALDADGRPLTAVITWADTRSAGAATALRRRLDAEAVRARTGAPLHAAFFPAKLGWLRESRPDVFGRAQTWCGFAEYVLQRLTGVMRTSLSMASGTGLLDQATGSWDVALLAEAGVAADRLPPISDAPVTGLRAPWDARWPALAAARWFPAWGDGACSNVGSDARGPDRIALNVGTSAAMRIVSPLTAETPRGLWRYRVDGNRSLVGGATSEGGNVVAWCRRVLALPEHEELEAALAAMAPDAHGLTVLPFLAGERSPGWRADARAAIAGLTQDVEAPEILRALMEAVAYRLALVYELLAPLARAGHTVVASGGALTRSQVWSGIVADVIGVPLTISAEGEASSRGAAVLALEGLGRSVPAAAQAGAGVVLPDPRRHEVYRRGLERQRRLYENVVGPPLS